MKPKTFYIIAVGGYLEKPQIDKIGFTTEQLKEHVGFPSSKQMVDYVLEEEVAEYAQGFSGAIVLKESDFKRIIKESSKVLTNNFS